MAGRLKTGMIVLTRPGSISPIVARLCVVILRAPRKGTIAAFAAAVALVLLVRWHWAGGPYSRDEASYMVVAHEVRFGHLPNVTAWAQRPPGAYIGYAAVDLLPLGPDRKLDVLAAVCLIVTAFGVYLWLVPLAGSRAAFGALLLFCLVSSDVSMQGQTANSELMISALLVLSFAALVRHFAAGGGAMLIAAGLLVGISGTIKEHTVAMAAAQLVCIALAAPHKWRSAMIYAAAAAAPWLLILLIYVPTGNARIIFDTFLFNAAHVALPWRDLAGGPILLAKLGYAYFGTWPLWLCTIFLCGLIPPPRAAMTVIAAFLAACATVVASGWFFAHYLIVAAPAVVAGTVLYIDQVARRSRVIATVVACAIGIYAAGTQLLFIRGHIPLGVRELIPVGDVERRQRVFGEILGRRAAGAKALLYGIDAGLLFYSELRPSEPILWLSLYDSSPLKIDAPFAHRFIDRIESAIARRPPDLIILQEPLAPDRPVARFLAPMVARDYVPVPISEVAPPSFRCTYRDIHVLQIYRRRGFYLR